MQRVFMLSASIAVVTWAANAFADSPNLKGDYGFTRTVKCIVSTDSSFPHDMTFGESFAEEGVRTFNGDGNGKQSFKALNIIIPADHPGAASSEVTDQPFAYSVNGDGTWSVPGNGSITGMVDTGPRHGQTFTIFPIGPSLGHISTNAATLTLSTVTPTIETITYSSPIPDGYTTFYRICNRSSVEISLPPGQ
jgi:hypothetical protein